MPSITFDFIDPNHIFLLGNTIGGSVALISAALDERIAAVVVVSAFSPWRTSNQQFETIRNYSHAHGFLPRLGYFAHRPDEVPVDFTEIIATIAPRPLMIISPELDRHADLPSIKKSIESVKAVYNLYPKAHQLYFDTPREINRMTTEMNETVADFYGRLIE